MNIMFGLCGAGARFKSAGYNIPKFLIAYHGAPMIYHAVETLGIPGKIHFVIRKEHLQEYKFLEKMLLELGSEIILSDGPTDGAASTLLLAKSYITDLNAPLLSVNCDQYLNWNSTEFLNAIYNNPETSYILTFKSTSANCSYIRKDISGKIIEVREKQQISNDAATGMYHWAHTYDFITDAEHMIHTGIKDHNEYYVAPVYNHTISRGLLVNNFEMTKNEFWPVGTPAEMAAFCNSNRSDQ